MTALTPPQARIVRELAYTPGAQNIRRKFGEDAILTDYGRGYYLPKDWARR